MGLLHDGEFYQEICRESYYNTETFIPHYSGFSLMFRTLILFIAIAIVVWMVSRMIKNKTSQAGPKKKKKIEIKTIVQCHLCNVYVPESNAIKQDEHIFCSQEHFEQWKNN